MNPMAGVLYTLGGLTILGGLILGFDTKNLVNSIMYSGWTEFFMWFGPSIVFGSVLIGFGEVIRLLDEKNKILKSVYQIDEDTTEEALSSQTLSPVDYSDKLDQDKIEEVMDSWKKNQ